MTEAEKAAQAQRERELQEREERLNKRQAEFAHGEHVAFAEGLAKEGRLLPASQPRVVALLDSLAAPAPTEVSFSEPGGQAVKESPADAVRAILKAQPVVVNFGDFSGEHGQPGRATADFASPDGRAVDAAGLQHLGRAQAYQKKNPDATFEQALAATTE